MEGQQIDQEIAAELRELEAGEDGTVDEICDDGLDDDEEDEEDDEGC